MVAVTLFGCLSSSNQIQKNPFVYLWKTMLMLSNITLKYEYHFEKNIIEKQQKATKSVNHVKSI